MNKIFPYLPYTPSKVWDWHFYICLYFCDCRRSRELFPTSRDPFSVSYKETESWMLDVKKKVKWRILHDFGELFQIIHFTSKKTFKSITTRRKGYWICASGSIMNLWLEILNVEYLFQFGFPNPFIENVCFLGPPLILLREWTKIKGGDFLTLWKCSRKTRKIFILKGFTNVLKGRIAYGVPKLKDPKIKGVQNLRVQNIR